MNETENKIQEAENKKSSISGLFHKVTDFGKKAVEEVQKGAKAISDKSKDDAYQKRLEKYNPVTVEEYESESFSLPSMIVVVDDSKRSEVDVFENAVGWRTVEKDIQVFHLFEDSAKIRDIKFFPNCQCNSFYYIDDKAKHNYTRVDCIFSKAHDEKMAELKHIAHSLGAKSCTIEITEKHYNSDTKKSGHGIKAVKSASGFKGEDTSTIGEYRSGKITATFVGNDSPKKPKLKWFANDQSIKKLIETRCTDTNTIKSETLILKGSNSAVMSQKTAYSIDVAICKVGGKTSIEKQAVIENDSVLVFSVEF